MAEFAAAEAQLVVDSALMHFVQAVVLVEQHLLADSGLQHSRCFVPRQHFAEKENQTSRAGSLLHFFVGVVVVVVVVVAAAAAADIVLFVCMVEHSVVELVVVAVLAESHFVALH